jgi:hypothetical protein
MVRDWGNTTEWALQLIQSVLQTLLHVTVDMENEGWEVRGVREWREGGGGGGGRE